MITRVLTALACAALVSSSALPAANPPASATLARDIDGVRLGMTIAQVRDRMPLEHVAFETYQGASNGIDFALGFTPAGRVFRIESRQLLGQFVPDAAFTASLSAKLAAKYGPPAYSHLPNGPAHWGLAENVSDANGDRNPFTVMWAEAMLEPGERGVTLAMIMLDFRILWEDQAKRNEGQSDAADARIRL